MLQGMVVSNSILIVDFATDAADWRRTPHRRRLVANACRIRLRPILMTSLRNRCWSLLPIAFKLETGSEAPMRRWRWASSVD